MDYGCLGHGNDITDAEAGSFRFHPEGTCNVRILRAYEEKQDGRSVIFQEQETFKSGKEYLSYLKENARRLRDSQDPALFLVLHQRLEGPDTQATSLPYEEDVFLKACDLLLQHRSIVTMLGGGVKVSTAAFASTSVAWGDEGPAEEGEEGDPAENGNGVENRCSTVYHCKSDTESLESNDDIMLSATCLTDKPIRFAVVYGCTKGIMDTIEGWLEDNDAAAFHPLLLPMVFAELERKRLLRAFENSESDLQQRILNMENRLRVDGEKSEKGKMTRTKTTTTRDYETIQHRMAMNSLNNGLEAFRKQLSDMREHLDKLPKFNYGNAKVNNTKVNENCSAIIDSRLNSMMTQLEGRLRKCAGLLENMNTSIQMEWNYHSRQDAKLNFAIASEQKRDGNQMKHISLLGMIFLPGTFLGSLFSMSFFNWPLYESNVVSPYIAVYLGLTTALTTITVVWWRKRMAEDAKLGMEELHKQMKESDADSMDTSSADGYSKMA